jgi:hypothetical protein
MERKAGISWKETKKKKRALGSIYQAGSKRLREKKREREEIKKLLTNIRAGVAEALLSVALILMLQDFYRRQLRRPAQCKEGSITKDKYK